DKETVAETLKHYGLMEKQIEEFITSHSALESQTETESQPGTPSVTTRMTRMIKIFENQSTMLEKALNDQQTIESKYKQLETDFQMLIMEKALLEGEIRRLREIERAKSAAKEEQTKKSGKSEKKKFKEKEKNLSPKIEFKSLEELLQIQKEAELLKTEKKTLQGQLKWALE
ncbi:coiled-coil domain-containing protein 7-like, partial [Mus caroli]|uniref:Coiled-coil domain-containing protein 7-like n=1 Tax=Mus caroli TaxID=10089 RepID=A0A6P5P7J0_MUSCR